MKKLLFLSIFLMVHCSFFILHCNAQWQQTNGPYGGVVGCFAEKENGIFMGNSNGVYMSTDNGVHWITRNKNLENIFVSVIVFRDSEIYAGTGKGIYKSTDNGLNWYPFGLNSYDIYSLIIKDNNFYAGCGWDGVFISTNNGKDWDLINNQLLLDEYVSSIVVNGKDIFIGTYGGIFKSSDEGLSWNRLRGDMITSLGIDKDRIYAGTISNGIYLSKDYGKSWEQQCLYDSLRSRCGLVSDILINRINVYAATTHGVYISHDYGNSWNFEDDGLTSTETLSLGLSGSKIFLGTNGAGLFVSDTVKINWSYVNIELNYININSIVANGSNIYAGTEYGVFLSTDNGDNWIPKNKGLVNLNVISLAVDSSTIVIGTDGDGIYSSTNNGDDWKFLTKLQYDRLTESYPYIKVLLIEGSKILAGTNFGIFVSSDKGIHWTFKDNCIKEYGINSLVKHGSSLFAGTGINGVFISNDFGGTWNSINNGLTYTHISSLGITDSVLIAGTDKYVFKSKNFGLNWEKIENFIPGFYTNILSLGTFKNNIFAATNGGRVYLSKNNGLKWDTINGGLPKIILPKSFTSNDNYIFMGTSVHNYPSIPFPWGIWRRSLYQLGIGINELETKNDELKIKVYPNPANEITNIKYKIPDKSQTAIIIFDVVGREIEKLVDEIIEKGEHKITLNTTKYKKGVYFLQLRAEGNLVTKKFVVAK